MIKKLVRKILYKCGYKDSIFQKMWIFINTPYRKIKNSIARRKLQNKGENLLNEIYNVAKECGVIVWPEFGTLLGAYRNKSFISYDLDIDLGILASDYTTVFEKALERRGFTKIRSFSKVDVKSGRKKICELTYKFDGLSCDLFLSDLDEDNNRLVYVCPSKINELDVKYNVRQYKINYSTELENVRINGISLVFPGNVHEYLKSIYGDNYMIPIKNWKVPAQNPIMKMLDNLEVYALYSEY